MLIPLRRMLGHRRAGAAVLWAVAALLVTAIVGHAPADAAGGHAGSTAADALTVAAGLPDVGGHGDDGHADDLGCSIGEALCAIGIVLGAVLLRRLGNVPTRSAWRLRPAPRDLRSRLPAVAATSLSCGPTRLVRLQI